MKGDLRNSKSRQMRVAFIGGGIDSAIGRAHFSAINIDKRYSLVSGLFSLDEKVNRESAVNYGLSEQNVFLSLSDLLEISKSKIDAVIVLTPTPHHFCYVSELINQQIPVICEKALATSYAEVCTLHNQLNNNNSYLSIIYNYLGYTMVKELRRVIQSGMIGNISTIHIEMPQEGFLRKNKDGRPLNIQSWRKEDHEVATISLDLGVHLHAMIKYLTNARPLNVISSCGSFGSYSTIIDDVDCIIEYSNGIKCNMWYSKSALGYRNGLKIRVFGSEGSAIWKQSEPEILTLADLYGQTKVIDRGSDSFGINTKMYDRFKAGHPTGFVEALANYYIDIYDSLVYYLNTGEVNLGECFGIEEAAEGLRLMEAIHKSSRLKEWVSI